MLHLSYCIMSVVGAITVITACHNTVTALHDGHNMPKNKYFAGGESYAHHPIAMKQPKRPHICLSDKAGYEKMVKIDSEGKLLFYWNTSAVNDIENSVLDVELVYKKELAWLGFGLLSEREKIIGTTIHNTSSVLKYETTDGDGWPTGGAIYKEMDPEYQTLQDTRIVVQDGHPTTIMSFKELLKEEGGVFIHPSGDNVFSFAVGEVASEKSSNFTSPEKTYALTLNLTKEVDSSSASSCVSSPSASSSAPSSAPPPSKKFPKSSTLSFDQIIPIVLSAYCGVAVIISVFLVVYQRMTTTDDNNNEDSFNYDDGTIVVTNTLSIGEKDVFSGL